MTRFIYCPRNKSSFFCFFFLFSSASDASLHKFLSSAAYLLLLLSLLLLLWRQMKRRTEPGFRESQVCFDDKIWFSLSRRRGWQRWRWWWRAKDERQASKRYVWWRLSSLLSSVYTFSLLPDDFSFAALNCLYLIWFKVGLLQNRIWVVEW